ncbi:hypothetical protein BDR07DRAFT_1379859 [Suillus spraguei]|nr:hypothetical protein BDR07DRAFT_1379859 [Suillus spraguei]
MHSQVPFFIEGLRIPSSIQINNAVSIAIGERLLREAIYQGKVEMPDIAMLNQSTGMQASTSANNESSGPSLQTIQAAPLPWTFCQINSRGHGQSNPSQKRARLNHYTPPNQRSQAPIHASFIFSSCRDGILKVSRQQIWGTMSVSPSYEPDNQSAVPGEDFCDLSYDFREPDPFVLLDDSENTPGCKRMPADDPLLIWMNECNLFLAELLRHEGHRGYTSDEWTGQIFQRISLKTMGLHVQLGHTIGERCILPKKAFNDEFVLIDTNGVHEIGLDFCGCTTSQTHTKQLLRLVGIHRLLLIHDQPQHFMFFITIMSYPLNQRPPHMSFIIRWLFNRQHGLDATKVMLKRSGAAVIQVVWQVLQRVSVLCYALHVRNLGKISQMIGKMPRRPKAIDANFHLKRRAVSSDKTDPSPFTRLGLFRRGEILQVLHLGQDWRHTRGLAAMGVGTVDCARHNIKRPNGVGDLQKGEKWRGTRARLVQYQSCSFKHEGYGSRMLSRHTRRPFGDWNWKKVVGLGSLLLLKIKEAQTEKAEHGAAFKEFDSVISSENRMAWKAEMEAWEENLNDTTVTNPLELKGITITQASARLSLAQLEAEELERGVDLSLHPDVLPSVLVASGMDLKEEQYTEIECPPHKDFSSSKDWLMEADPTSHIEWELWFAQAHNALEELRQCLRVHCSLLNFKREWIRGQGANTQAQNALTCVHARQAACVKRYRTAWGALKRLAPILKKVDWHGRLQDLSDDDVKPLIDPFATQGEGRRRLTWIWMMDGVDSCADGGDVDGVCVEWCKSHARALRWAEEVDLLQEEMCRVLQFFNWQANWWEGQGVLQVYESAPCNGEELGTAACCEAAARDEGLRAYASQQANIRHCLAARFRSIWAPFISPQDILGNLTAMLPIPGNMP